MAFGKKNKDKELSATLNKDYISSGILEGNISRGHDLSDIDAAKNKFIKDHLNKKKKRAKVSAEEILVHFDKYGLSDSEYDDLFRWFEANGLTLDSNPFKSKNSSVIKSLKNTVAERIDSMVNDPVTYGSTTRDKVDDGIKSFRFIENVNSWWRKRNWSNAW